MRNRPNSSAEKRKKVSWPMLRSIYNGTYNNGRRITEKQLTNQRDAIEENECMSVEHDFPPKAQGYNDYHYPLPLQQRLDTGIHFKSRAAGSSPYRY